MLSKNMLRCLNDVKIKEFFILAIQDIGVAYEDFAPLLGVGSKEADLFYDYGTLIQEALDARDLPKVKALVLQLEPKLSVYGILCFWKQVLAHSKLPTVPFNLFNLLIPLLLELKVGHTICGFNEDTGEVFLDESYPAAYEMLLCFDLRGSLGLGFRDSKTGTLFKVTTSEKQKFITFLKLKYGNGVLEEAMLKALKITPIEKALMTEDYYLALSEKIFKNYVNTVFATTAFQIFNNDYFPQSVLDCCNWTPEFSSMSKNSTMGIFIYLLEMLGTNSVLYKRNRLVREDGVLIRFNDKFDGFDQVLVKEIHDRSGHYLMVVGQLDCGLQRTVVLNLEDVSQTDSLLLYEVDASLLMCVFEWLGLREELHAAIEGLKYTGFTRQLFKTLTNEPVEEAFELVKSEALRFIDTFCKVARKALDDAEYLKPLHWNYMGTTKFNKKARSSLGDYCELRRVGAHVRKLSRGHASEEAKAAAKRYCIELKPGYTLVSEYVRKQHIKESI